MAGPRARAPFADGLDLTPISRWPTRLSDQSTQAVIGTPVDRRLRRPRAAPSSDPSLSIVVVAWNALAFSRLCLESLVGSRVSIEFEVVVVDNGSTDGTSDYLAALAALEPRVRVVSFAANAGFAAATNVGVARARGPVILLLNNDTIVPRGTLERIAAHVKSPGVGLLGAVTNRAGNEAQVATSYRTYGQLQRFARRRQLAHRGEVFDIRTATMFCLALRRDVWDMVGPVDERFEVGLFEDDDYSMRARRLGYRVVCAEDVYVHHFGQASIGQLGPTGEYGRVFHANRARWEAKWHAVWQPYDRRERPRYRTLVKRVRRLVCEQVPADATVAVITKGDGDLLELAGRRAWHFPEGEPGTYAGHYPADGQACIEELERLRARGAEFLVIPATSRWWLQYYEPFRAHLRRRYRTLGTDRSATIFQLSRPRAAARRKSA
jgi:GT2 family glycosyltransferase